MKIEKNSSVFSGVKGVIFGPYKIGKTSLLRTLDPETTLFVDMEAGSLSVKDWPGDRVRLDSWENCRDLACLIGGPDYSARIDQSYSMGHHDAIEKMDLSKYKTFFFDSITEASRLALNWCKGRPEATSERTGKPDGRAAYGLLKQEMVRWVRHLQHSEGVNVWLVGLLDEKVDEFGRRVFVPEIEGQATALELPGLVDEVITMSEISVDDSEPFRAFVCQRPNPWGFPAGDRSGVLEMVEEPNLSKLMDKIMKGKSNA